MTRLGYRRERLLIWGKTYPELSSRYTETVCTGALREDGRPVRIYPVPLRYLEGEQQYKLYDVIQADVTKSPDDPRPESYRIDRASLALEGNIPPDKNLWEQRREWVFRDTSWHFGSVEAVKAAQRESGISIGLVTPGEVVNVRTRRKGSEAESEHRRKWDEVTNAGQVDLFPREYKKLAFIPFEIRLEWRCLEACHECTNGPHDMMVLDWGLLELGRREGAAAAGAKLAEVANLSSYEFRIFMGNFRLHPYTFGVTGLWYPKRRPQQDMFIPA